MMNSALRQSARVAQRRYQSSKVSTTFLTKKKASFNEAWLSDPSAYPLIAIMGAAGALVVGVSVSCLAFSPDVQISPNRRGSVMRNWEM